MYAMPFVAKSVTPRSQKAYPPQEIRSFRSLLEIAAIHVSSTALPEELIGAEPVLGLDRTAQARQQLSEIGPPELQPAPRAVSSPQER